MKKYIIAIMVLMGGVSNYCVAQNAAQKKAFTFEVDKGLKPFGRLSTDKSAENVAEEWVKEDNAGSVVAKSWNDSLYFKTSSVFFDCLVEAYMHHHSVVLSPDIIWTMISQGFCQFVNDKPERFRSLLVNHQGKKLLKVRINRDDDVHSPSFDWEEVLDGFDKLIAENTKGDIADVMRADFSTTGKTERIASQITLMSTVKAYFDYMVIIGICGIPSITIEGTPDDWRKVLDKTRRLSVYGIEDWVEDLEPILEEFVAASKGNPNVRFWQAIVKRDKIDEISQRSCAGGSKPTKLDGWFLKFMPFDKNGRTPESVYYDTPDMKPNVVSLPFKCKKEGEDVTLTMSMHAGLVGIDVDGDANTMRPRIGWMVCEETMESEMTMRDLMTKDETYAKPDFVLTEVPELFKDIEFMKKLHLEFIGEPDLPDRFGDVKIDEIVIDGGFTSQYVRQIKDLFKANGRKVSVKRNGGAVQVSIKARNSFDSGDMTYTYGMINGDAAYIEAMPSNGYRYFDEYIDNNRRIAVSKDNYVNADAEKVRDGNCSLVDFTIELDGSITDVKIHENNNLRKECRDEAERLIKAMPNWQPAIRLTSHGHVAVRYRAMEKVRF